MNKEETCIPEITCNEKVVRFKIKMPSFVQKNETGDISFCICFTFYTAFKNETGRSGKILSCNL
jgi:hypothetical protein